MRVLRDRWLANNLDDNPGKENNQDFGKEVVPNPNNDYDLNDDNIITFLNMAEERYLANKIKCDNQEITAENVIATVQLNNVPNIDSIVADVFDETETELVDIENISDELTTDSERLQQIISKTNDVQDSNVQIEAAAEKTAHEENYADIYIENTVMELWVADLLSKYPHLYDLPI